MPAMQSPSLAPTYLKDPSPYLVDAAVEVDHLLQHLLLHGGLLCLYPKGRREPVVISAILELDDTQLYLDSSPDSTINQLLLRRGLIAVTQLRGVKHQFESELVASAEIDQRLALAIPRPRQMLRLQRRRSYRLALPLGAPILCTLSEMAVALPIADLSQDGLALVADAPLDLQLGQTLAAASFALPDGSKIETALRLQSVVEAPRKVGPPAIHYGFRMLSLSPTARRALQRYLVQLERQRLERER